MVIGSRASWSAVRPTWPLRVEAKEEMIFRVGCRHGVPGEPVNKVLDFHLLETARPIGNKFGVLSIFVIHFLDELSQVPQNQRKTSVAQSNS